MKNLAQLLIALVSVTSCVVEPETPTGHVEQADQKCARPDPAFNPKTCVKESNKELCWDNWDNNCDGCIDEGCPVK